MKLWSFGILFFLVGIAIGFFFRYHQIIAQTVSPSPSSLPSSSGSFTGVAQPQLPSQTVSPTGFFGSSSPSSLSRSSNVPGSEQHTNTSVEDPQIAQHTNANGGRGDIVQIGEMTASQSKAYTGDDITFSVTIKNVANYKKFVKSFCFTSSDGNFGCSPGFNLSSGQVFTISNSGRFTSSGIKNIQVSWSQDGENYVSPVNASSVTVTIL